MAYRNGTQVVLPSGEEGTVVNSGARGHQVKLRDGSKPWAQGCTKKEGGGTRSSYSYTSPVRAASTAMSPTLPQEQQEVKYRELQEAMDFDGECRCGKYSNETITVSTDMGMKEVVKCSSCGNIMLPKR